MIFSSLLIGISSSIDSFGIGITYGMNNTKISSLSNFILFFITFLISTISIIFGSIIKNFLPEYLSKLLGCILIALLGVYMIFQAFENSKCSSNFSDFDNSKDIDVFEAVFLGATLSIDSFCIVISSSMIDFYNFSLPLIISLLQIIFLKIGTKIGKKIQDSAKFPDNYWSVISGVLLIAIGLTKLF